MLVSSIGIQHQSHSMGVDCVAIVTRVESGNGLAQYSSHTRVSKLWTSTLDILVSKELELLDSGLHPDGFYQPTSSTTSITLLLAGLGPHIHASLDVLPCKCRCVILLLFPERC